MDIIDIMLARAMTPQGKTEAYVAKAEKAAQKAAAAESSAAAAIQTVESAADEIATAREEAASLLTEAQTALETAQAAQINTLSTEDVDEEINKLDVSVNLVEGANANTYQVITTYPDNTLNTENATKMYKATGANEDGTMTQKAITDALTSKADAATAATKQYVDDAIAAIPSGGGSGSGSGDVSNLGTDSAGHIVIVGDDGNISASDTTEDNLIEALIRSGIYQAKDAVGLDINYQDKSFIRTQEAASFEMGTDFDAYPMYGGRKRCNVADNGVITAFYGDANYKDDGTNGQVMIYQPKFYYQRLPLKLENTQKGQAIRRESILISATEQSGFKLHPLFDAGNGEAYDYVLLPAYEGAVLSDRLYSIAGQQPTTNITIETAENYAKARGTGWHIMNMQAISANQMLEMIEFGSLNGQTSLEDGVSNLPATPNVNCSAITGSTASLGNATGHAESTISNNDGTTVTNTTAGTRAISYRGMENPWGNVWQMIGGINIKGDGQSQGGSPYICTDFNYSASTIEDNYEYIGFNLPAIYGWISALGYGAAKYDWVLLPIECGSNANSLLPVGDNLWTISGVNENKILAVGGTYEYKENNGMFYYAADRDVEDSARTNYGARLMYIPTKNAIYQANINKWKALQGG